MPPMDPDTAHVPGARHRRVAERLKNAQNTYAMLSTFNEVDMTNIMEMRKAFKVGGCRTRQGVLRTSRPSAAFCETGQLTPVLPNGTFGALLPALVSPSRPHPALLCP